MLVCCVNKIFDRDLQCSRHRQKCIQNMSFEFQRNMRLIVQSQNMDFAFQPLQCKLQPMHARTQRVSLGFDYYLNAESRDNLPQILVHFHKPKSPNAIWCLVLFAISSVHLKVTRWMYGSFGIYGFIVEARDREREQQLMGKCIYSNSCENLLTLSTETNRSITH